jgi:hypothetical protein
MKQYQATHSGERDRNGSRKTPGWQGYGQYLNLGVCYLAVPLQKPIAIFCVVL